MQLLTRFANRLLHGSGARFEDAPVILIAERFVSPVADLQRVDLPDDMRRIAPETELDALIIDEIGVCCRRTKLAPPPPGMPGNCIEFPPVPIQPGARLWLFVIESCYDGGAITPRLVDVLLTHGRRLGGRPPIILLWDHTAAVPEEPVSTPEPSKPKITFTMLSEDPDPALLPPLDQPEVDVASLTPEQREWRQDGVLILRQFFPNSVLDPYIAVREELNGPGGWLSPTPYIQVNELRRICLYPPLRQVMRELIGEEMMVHLNLTGWVTSERDWHQDDYLNPPFINSWYVAVWIALDHIDPDSGPFEYVPGSHRWPLLRGDKVRDFMTEDERLAELAPNGGETWPKVTERFVAPAVNAEIHERGVAPLQFLAEKGDTLIWHGRLLHRGTLAKRPGLERRAVIAHYSGVNHRPDMLARKVDEQGGTYALFDTPLF
jgi:hypothetical protein